MTIIKLKASDLSFYGVDYWGRAVFKNPKTGRFYCFVDCLYTQDAQMAMSDLLEKRYTLYAKGKDFEGEPDYPVDYLV